MGINSVSCGAACFQIKKPAGGGEAWCYQRMYMQEIFFSGFCYSPSSPSEPICTAVASSWQIDYVNEACGERRGHRRTGSGDRELSRSAGFMGYEWRVELYEAERQKFCAVPEAGPGSQCQAELAFPRPSLVASALKGEERQLIHNLIRIQFKWYLFIYLIWFFFFFTLVCKWQYWYW